METLIGKIIVFLIFLVNREWLSKGYDALPIPDQWHISVDHQLCATCALHSLHVLSASIIISINSMK